MLKIIKEELTKAPDDIMKEDEQEFEERLEDMIDTHKSLTPLIRQVRVLKQKQERILSANFDNINKIDSLEKKVEKIIEYLEKEQKKKNRI